MCKPRTHLYLESRDNMNWCQILVLLFYRKQLKDVPKARNARANVSRCRVGLKTRPPNFFFVFLGGTPVPPLEKKTFTEGWGWGEAILLIFHVNNNRKSLINCLCLLFVTSPQTCIVTRGTLDVPWPQGPNQLVTQCFNNCRILLHQRVPCGRKISIF